tara:strand:- start:4434 stop:4664 length:231 start_codon:yes stop_codon:yes gene_type:complete
MNKIILHNTNKMIAIIITYMLILFILFATIGALIYSLICFGYSGTPTDKIIGLVIAYLLGPFYWIYYYWHPTYCKK